MSTICTYVSISIFECMTRWGIEVEARPGLIFELWLSCDEWPYLHTCWVWVALTCFHVLVLWPLIVYVCLRGSIILFLFQVGLASLDCYSEIIHCVLWVSVAENPHETLLVLPGPPGGLKELPNCFSSCLLLVCLVLVFVCSGRATFKLGVVIVTLFCSFACLSIF